MRIHYGYPNENNEVRVTISWGNSKVNGEHEGYYVGKSFRARSGAVLRKFKCRTHDKDEYHPCTSDKSIIKWEY